MCVWHSSKRFLFHFRKRDFFFWTVWFLVGRSTVGGFLQPSLGDQSHLDRGRVKTNPKAWKHDRNWWLPFEFERQINYCNRNLWVLFCHRNDMTLNFNIWVKNTEKCSTCCKNGTLVSVFRKIVQIKSEVQTWFNSEISQWRFVLPMLEISRFFQMARWL